MTATKGAPRLVPDLDDELCHVLEQVEAALLTLSVWESDPDDQVGLGEPLAGRRALEALGRVQDAIAPTQTRVTGQGQQIPATVGPARLLAPDGRYEHRPLRLAVLDQRDLELLAAAAGELGRGLALDPHGDLAEALAAAVEQAHEFVPAGQPRPAPVSVVEAFARALGVLDLAVTEDTETLTRRVTDTAGRDVVLGPAEEAAYQRLVERINRMWTDGSGLDRFLY